MPTIFTKLNLKYKQQFSETSHMPKCSLQKLMNVYDMLILNSKSKA